MKIVEVPVNKIEQNENSRAIYKEQDLAELMASMKKDGLLQPVGVRKIDNGYEAIFGNRRILAAKKLGWADIPAHVVECESDIDRDILNLVENFKRQNTSVSEDGRIFQSLKDRGLKENEIAARLAISIDRVTLGLDVFNEFPKEFHKKIVNTTTNQAVRKGNVSAAAAFTIHKLKKRAKLDKKQVHELLTFAQNNDVSAKQLSYAAPYLNNGFTVKQSVREVSRLRHMTLDLVIDRRIADLIESKSGKSIQTMMIDYLIQSKRFGVVKREDSGMHSRSNSKIAAHMRA